MLSVHQFHLLEAILLEQGTLAFRIFASNAYIPIEGATVAVRSEDTPPKLLALRITDKSGETTPIMIDTPDRAMSQAPENQEKPWTSLTVLVEHPDFERVTLKGVQVFPGVTSLQSIQMIPVLEFDPEYANAQTYQFTPQPVWEG